MVLNLVDRHALVCGSSQGIGRATAHALAAAGARVTLCARDAGALEAVRGSLQGARHSVLVADFDDPATLQAIVARHVAAQGPIQILVNNTGGPPAGPALDADSDAYLTAFRRHLIVNQSLVSTLLPGMRASGYGRVVNVISTSVKEPIPGLGVSNTVRGAVAAWAKTLATELGPHGITVNNVLPGYTATARLASLFSGRAERAGLSLAQVEGEALASIPLGRYAEPEEIAQAILFLASPLAAYITGINLPVDGGRTRSL